MLIILGKPIIALSGLLFGNDLSKHLIESLFFVERKRDKNVFGHMHFGLLTVKIPLLAPACIPFCSML